MSPLLAQLSADLLGPLVTWLIGLSTAIFLANQIVSFWKDHLREKPAPADTYATKSEHGELRERVDRVEEKIEENYKTLDQKRSSSVANLHEAVRELSQQLNARIDEVPQRTIRLLAETKQLHQ